MEQSKYLTIYGSHCTLDWNNNYPNCQKPTIYPEALHRFDRIPPCTRTTFWRASCKGFSLSPWLNWDHIEGTLFVMFFWSYCLSYLQIRWVTMDNTSNNDTFMLKLDIRAQGMQYPLEQSWLQDKVGEATRFSWSRLKADYCEDVFSTLSIWLPSLHSTLILCP